MAPSSEAGSARQQPMVALNAGDPGLRAESAITLSAQQMASGTSGATGVDVPNPVMVAGRGE